MEGEEEDSSGQVEALEWRAGLRGVEEGEEDMRAEVVRDGWV